MTGDCCVFKFLRRSVDGKHLIRFQRENTGAVFKFLRGRVDKAKRLAHSRRKVCTGSQMIPGPQMIPNRK